jgi:NTE family protein
MLIIGVSAPLDDKPRMIERRRPSIGQMAGHLLNREFIDNLEADIELAGRFNTFAEELPPEARTRLGARHIDTLVITPSVHFSEIAVDYLAKQPRTLQLLFRLLGATARGAGASFASYLMFDGGFCSRLMDLGYQDALAERDRVRRFLEEPTVALIPPSTRSDDLPRPRIPPSAAVQLRGWSRRD